LGWMETSSSRPRQAIWVIRPRSGISPKALAREDRSQARAEDRASIIVRGPRPACILRRAVRAMNFPSRGLASKNRPLKTAIFL